MALDVGVCRQYERIFALLKYSDGESICEALDGGVEVVQRVVAALPPHEADGVWAHLRHEERHFPSRSEGSGADIFQCETDGRTRGSDDGADGHGDFSTVYLLPCLALLDGVNGGVAGGAILEKGTPHGDTGTPLDNLGGALSYTARLISL